jgi:hypothetical protein
MRELVALIDSPVMDGQEHPDSDFFEWSWEFQFVNYDNPIKSDLEEIVDDRRGKLTEPAQRDPLTVFPASPLSCVRVMQRYSQRPLSTNAGPNRTICCILGSAQRSNDPKSDFLMQRSPLIDLEGFAVED